MSKEILPDVPFFELYHDNKEDKDLLFVQYSKYQYRNEENKLIEKDVVVVRYIGGKSLILSLEEWNFVSSKTGNPRFVKK